MQSSDGKKYLTECANTETMFRIIQSIPSPKAEPFKRWLAQVGYERIQEIENLELAAQRARQHYKDLGYSDDKTYKTQFYTVLEYSQNTGSPKIKNG